MQFVVLCSSKGTVFESVLDSIKNESLQASCIGLVTDRHDRGCALKAQAAKLPIVVVEKKQGETREAYDERLLEGISTLSPDENTIIACMGWMWLLSPLFVSTYHNRILNVHPALLPKHPGAHAHALVLQAKDTESGMTIHLIDEGIDTGKILVQKRCPVFPDDTEETLKKRVQALECEWYPKTLQMIHEGTLTL